MSSENSIEAVLDTDWAELRYFIDLSWYQENNRSFSAIAKSRMCPACQNRLTEEREGAEARDLLVAISDCCSNAQGFITSSLPILEAAFRLFLANGNQPLGLEEISEQLTGWRGGSGTPSPQILRCLLDNDRYYGLRRAP